MICSFRPVKQFLFRLEKNLFPNADKALDLGLPVAHTNAFIEECLSRACADMHGGPGTRDKGMTICRILEISYAISTHS